MKKNKKDQEIIEALKACIITIRSYHQDDYCPTVECSACNSRHMAEMVLKRLEKKVKNN